MIIPREVIVPFVLQPGESIAAMEKDLGINYTTSWGGSEMPPPRSAREMFVLRMWRHFNLRSLCTVAKQRGLIVALGNMTEKQSNVLFIYPLDSDQEIVNFLSKELGVRIMDLPDGTAN